MRGSILFAFVEISNFIFGTCLLGVQGTGCGLNRLTYGGRLFFADRQGQEEGISPPRMFILQSPRRRKTPFGGRGHIWVTSGQSACDRSLSGQQFCPAAQENFPCMASSIPCYAGIPPPIVTQNPDVDGVTVTLPPELTQSIGKNDSNVTGWEIVLRNEAGEYFSNVTKEISDTIHHFQNFPGGNYVIIIFLIYVNGDHGPPSPPMNVNIPCGELNDFGLSLRTTAKLPGFARVEVRWHYSTPSGACEVQDQNVTIEQLDVNFCGPLDGELRFSAITSQARRTRWKRLRPFTLYRVTLYVTTTTRVYNITKEVRTPSTAPNVSPSMMDPVKRGEGVTFKWSDLPCGSRNGNITNYDYVLKMNGNEMVPTNTTARRARFNGFKAGQHYGFKVRACTKDGCGPYCEERTGIF